MEELLKTVIDQLNERLQNDEKLRESIKDKRRTVEIVITDDDTYNFLLEDAEAKNFGQGSLDDPDVKITTDSATLQGIIKEEINPLKAYVTKKLQVKASLMDLLTIKTMLGG